MRKTTGTKVITTHLADNNDPFKTACGIDMPDKNRASGLKECALLCTDCVKVAMGWKGGYNG